MRHLRISTATAALAATLALASAANAQSAPTLDRTYSASGNIKEADSKNEADQRYDQYRLRLTAGQRVRAAANSDDFDTLLQVFRDGESDEALAENDDAGDELDSQLTFSPDRDGVYVFRIVSFDESSTGKYTLRVDALGPLPPPIREAGTPGATLQFRTFASSLTTEDPDSEGSHFKDYLVTLSEGGEAIIRLDSTEFDPIVSIAKAEQRDGEQLATNDDGGGETNALLVFKAPASGDYVVRVTSYGTGTGAYTLRIGQ